MRLTAVQAWGRNKPLVARDGMSRFSLSHYCWQSLQKLILHALIVYHLAYNTLRHSHQPTVQFNDVYLPPS